MDNLWVYLILIFGYVGYSLVKSARKQREGDGEESEEERFFSEEQDLRRNLNDVLKSRPGTIPASVYDRGAATGGERIEKGSRRIFPTFFVDGVGGCGETCYRGAGIFSVQSRGRNARSSFYAPYR